MLNGMAQKPLTHFHTPVSRVAAWVNVVLVLMLAYSLAELTWLVVSDQTEPSSFIVNEVSNGTTGVRPSPGLDSVAAMHLLGDSHVTEAGQAPETIEAPKTRLNLSLKGLFTDDDPERAMAIIASGAHDEKAYHVGDVIAGAARIHQVLPDRVILERTGKFETLFLPREKVDTNTPLSSYPSNIHAANSSPRVAIRRIPEVRQLLLQSPEQALKLINAQPVLEGGILKGFRVMPGENRALFAKAGLRPGDVVTAVNGKALSMDITKVEQLLQQLKGARDVNVSIERGGRPITLSLKLD